MLKCSQAIVTMTDNRKWHCGQRNWKFIYLYLEIWQTALSSCEWHGLSDHSELEETTQALDATIVSRQLGKCPTTGNRNSKCFWWRIKIFNYNFCMKRGMSQLNCYQKCFQIYATNSFCLISLIGWLAGGISTPPRSLEFSTRHFRRLVFTTRCTIVQSAVLRLLVVRLSVTLVDQDHVGWNTSKIILRLISISLRSGWPQYGRSGATGTPQN